MTGTTSSNVIKTKRKRWNPRWKISSFHPVGGLYNSDWCVNIFIMVLDKNFSWVRIWCLKNDQKVFSQTTITKLFTNQSEFNSPKQMNKRVKSFHFLAWNFFVKSINVNQNILISTFSEGRYRFRHWTILHQRPLWFCLLCRAANDTLELTSYRMLKFHRTRLHLVIQEIGLSIAPYRNFKSFIFFWHDQRIRPDQLILPLPPTPDLGGKGRRRVGSPGQDTHPPPLALPPGNDGRPRIAMCRDVNARLSCYFLKLKTVGNLFILYSGKNSGYS